MLLAGDIGGTKTVVALFEERDGKLQQLRDATFASRDHGSLEEILDKFLQGERLTSGCFGVAGAVVEGKADTTNLPWTTLDEGALAQAIGAASVKLLNDLEAAAYGMLHLEENELVQINPYSPRRRKGNVAIVAAGTGLGEATMCWDGKRYHTLASEGGHVDFAPRNELEIGLLRYLWRKLGGHVSYERILSGPGYLNLYEFLRDEGHHPESEELRRRMRDELPAKVITELGLAESDPLCAATNKLFCSLYGAEASNLALKCLAVGGVFIGGGIAPKMLDAFKKPHFFEAFIDKGRFRSLLETIPVSVALNPRAPLIGAAHYAELLN